MEKVGSDMKKEMTLKTRFILTSYCSVVISIMLIGIASYCLLGSMSKKFVLQTSEEAVRQKNEDIQTKLDGIEVTLRDIIYNSELQQTLTDYQGADPYSRRMAVNNSIARASNSLYMLDNIAVFTKSGQMIGSMYEFNGTKKAEDYSWYDKMKASNGETIWLDQTIRRSKDNYGSHMEISAVKKIRALSGKYGARMGEELGCVCFSVNLDALLKFEQDYGGNEERQMLVAAGNGMILGGTEIDKNGTEFPVELLTETKNHTYVRCGQEKELLIYDLVGQNIDWYTICLVPRRAVLKNFYLAIMVCFTLSVFLLVALLLFSIYNAELISRPVRSLEEQCKLVANGTFDIGEERSGIREIDGLFAHFREMAGQLDHLIHKVYETRIEEQNLIAESREAQLQALQMQINPHFLYNTLDSINWMALMAGADEVSKMVLALGHLFRSNMNTSGIYTKVSDAVENVKLYMYLQQVRFEGGLAYQVEMEEEVQNAMILKNLIQPLVENSIKHGMQTGHAGGEIHISIKKVEEHLQVEVGDNGKGIEETELEKLKRQWQEISKDEKEERRAAGKVGIHNIMRRLWLCYGSEASFDISSTYEKGTQMIISFPLEYRIIQKNSDAIKESDEIRNF